MKEAAKAEREAKKRLQKSFEGKEKRQTCPVVTAARPKQTKIKENMAESIKTDLWPLLCIISRKCGHWDEFIGVA